MFINIDRFKRYTHLNIKHVRVFCRFYKGHEMIVCSKYDYGVFSTTGLIPVENKWNQTCVPLHM